MKYFLSLYIKLSLILIFKTCNFIQVYWYFCFRYCCFRIYNKNPRKLYSVYKKQAFPDYQDEGSLLQAGGIHCDKSRSWKTPVAELKSPPNNHQRAFLFYLSIHHFLKFLNASPIPPDFEYHSLFIMCFTNNSYPFLNRWNIFSLLVGNKDFCS